MTTQTHRAHLTDADTIKKYVLGGHATITLLNARTGERFTYKVRCKRSTVAQGRKVTSPYFVNVMTGPDNESSYSYMGYITSGGKNEYRHGGSKAKVPTGTGQHIAFEWFWALVNGRNRDGSPRTLTVADYPDLEVWHEGHCCCCGRKLTVPESIATGVGPVCAGWY